MATIRVHSLPSRVTDQDLSESFTAVIDVLRATSTIVQAFSSGCKRVIPAVSREDALKLKSSYPEALLCGESRGLKIDSFDLGNSPVEFTPEKVDGKELIFCTSNGTVAMRSAMARNARLLAACSFLNLEAVAARITAVKPDSVAIICSGSHGEESVEDLACAGALSERLMSLIPGSELDRQAQDAVDLYCSYGRDILKILTESSHGRYLMDLGFTQDIVFCSNLNSKTAVPMLQDDGTLTL